MYKFTLFLFLGLFFLNNDSNGATERGFTYFCVCGHCGKNSKNYEDKKSAMSHVREAHLKKIVYKKKFYDGASDAGVKENKCLVRCSICGVMRSGRESLNKHIESIHFRIGYKCSVCGAIRTRKDRLLDHMKTHKTPVSGLPKNVAEQKPAQEGVVQGLSMSGFDSNLALSDEEKQMILDFLKKISEEKDLT